MLVVLEITKLVPTSKSVCMSLKLTLLELAGEVITDKPCQITGLYECTYERNSKLDLVLDIV